MLEACALVEDDVTLLKDRGDLTLVVFYYLAQLDQLVLVGLLQGGLEGVDGGVRAGWVGGHLVH